MYVKLIILCNKLFFSRSFHHARIRIIFMLIMHRKIMEILNDLRILIIGHANKCETL